MIDKPTKRVVVVLSPGRSGTALLMKVLGILGMRLSEKMISGSVGNPEGFFEDAEIVDVHKKLLIDLNTHPTLPLPDHWLDSEAAVKARSALRKILENNLVQSNAIWGFKDPRTVSFLPLWNRILNVPGIVPVFLLAVRDPSAVVISQNRLIGLEKAITELQWLQRTVEALHHISADCFIVHYEDWFIRAGELAEGLLKYTGLVRYFTGDMNKAITEVVKPNLNRAVYEDYQVKNEYVLKLYDVLKDCRGDEFDRERLMAVTKECSKAMNGFKGWYMVAQKYISRNLSLIDKLHDQGDKISALKKKIDKNMMSKNGKLDELQVQVKASRDDLERSPDRAEEPEEIKNMAAERVREIRTLKSHRLQEKNECIAEMKNDLHEITLQNNQYLIQIKDLHDEVQELRISLSSTRCELAQHKQHNDNVFMQNQPDPYNAQSNMQKLEREMFELRNSYSFRIGQILVNTVAKPGVNTIIFPFQLIRLITEHLFKRSRKTMED